MSGAADALNAIQQVLRGAYGPCYRAGADYAAACKAALSETDLVAAMGAALDAIRAAEHLHDVAEMAAKDARTQLALTMEETGCTQVSTATLTGYLQRKPAFVDVSGPVPPEYMRQPPAAPDKHALKTALEAGTDIPGATLVRPNQQTLAIRTRSS